VGELTGMNKQLAFFTDLYAGSRDERIERRWSRVWRVWRVWRV
jgi:hypothetical protein